MVRVVTNLFPPRLSTKAIRLILTQKAYAPACLVVGASAAGDLDGH